MGGQKSAEVVVAVVTVTAKGRTRKTDWDLDHSMGAGVAARMAEMPSLARGGSRRNRRDNRDKATSPTA